jgi:hypothetical protein
MYRSVGVLAAAAFFCSTILSVHSAEDIATCTDNPNLEAVTAKVANVQAAIEELAADDSASTTDVAIETIGTSLTELGDRIRTITILLNETAAAAAATAAAEAAAKAGAGGGGPAISFVSSVPGNSCGASKATACPVAYHANDVNAADPVVTVFVRTPGSAFHNMPGVYVCNYKLSTTEETVSAPALLMGQNGVVGSIRCPAPVQNPDDTSQATWSAVVTVTEGGETSIAVPKSKKVTVWFGSDAPAFSITGLHKKNGGYFIAEDSVKQSKVTMVFAVADRDSVQGKITVAAAAVVSKWITAIKLGDPDSESLRTMVLTLDADYAGDLTSTITLKGTDEHDNVGVRTFPFTLCGVLGANGCAPILASLCDEGACQEKKDAAEAAVLNNVIRVSQVFESEWGGLGQEVSAVTVALSESYQSGIGTFSLSSHPHTCPADTCDYTTEVRVYIKDKNNQDVLELGTLDVKLGSGKVLKKAAGKPHIEAVHALQDFTFQATGKTHAGDPGASSRKLQAGDRLVVEWDCASGASLASSMYCHPAVHVGAGSGWGLRSDVDSNAHGELWIYPGWSNCPACNKWSINGQPTMDFFYKFQGCEKYCG